MSPPQEVQDRKQSEKRREENLLLNEFVSVLLSQLKSSNIRSIPKDQRSEYQEERKGLSALNQSGLVEGVVATCVTFAALRTIPKIIAKRLISRRGYTLDPPPGTTSAGNPFQHSTTSVPSSEQPRGGFALTMLSLAKVVFDVYASLLVGALVANSSLDDTQLFPKLASLPLVEGRSFVADEFCKAIQDKVKERPSTFWSEVDSFYLKQLKVFSDNCTRRQAFENKIRREHGLLADDPVVIPKGGVPMDYSTEIDQDSEFSSDMDQIFDEQADDEWADDMVSDQEDDRRKT